MARPRSETARQAALDATLDLLQEGTVDRLTFEDVAARSGVAKTTLYRHFGTKQAMLVAAASSCFVEHPTPDTGSLLDDLRTIVRKGKVSEEKHRVADVMPAALLAASDSDPQLQGCLRKMLDERRRPIRTVLQLAQLRGEIDRDLDLDVAVSIVIGPFVQRQLVDRMELTDDWSDAVLTTVVAGLRATAGQVQADPVGLPR